MSASGLYTIDGYDFFDAFNYAINNSRTASNLLLAFPEADEPYSYRWKNEGITEYDLSNPTFLDKDVTFTGAIIATSKADFWQKYLALWDLLKQPGERTIYSSELEQAFTCFYKKMPKLDRFTRLKENGNGIVVDIDITFRVMFSELVLPGDDGKLNQSINFPNIPNKSPDSPDFTLVVSATSGLPVTLVSNNESVATVSGNVVHIISVGTASITASQAGNENYNPATSITRTFNVVIVKLDQTITFPSISVKTIGDADFSPGASATSGLTVSYVSSNLSVATIVSGQIRIIGIGTANITASQAGDSSYNPAVSVSRSFIVTSVPVEEHYPYQYPVAFGEPDTPENNTLPGTLPFTLS